MQTNAFRISYLVSSGEHGGRPYTLIAFERAIASCTPFVPFVPFVAKLASRLLASHVLPLTSCLSRLSEDFPCKTHSQGWI